MSRYSSINVPHFVDYEDEQIEEFISTFHKYKTFLPITRRTKTVSIDLIVSDDFDDVSRQEDEEPEARDLASVGEDPLEPVSTAFTPTSRPISPTTRPDPFAAFASSKRVSFAPGSSPQASTPSQDSDSASQPPPVASSTRMGSNPNAPAAQSTTQFGSSATSVHSSTFPISPPQPFVYTPSTIPTAPPPTSTASTQSTGNASSGTPLATGTTPRATATSATAPRKASMVFTKLQRNHLLPARSRRVSPSTSPSTIVHSPSFSCCESFSYSRLCYSAH